MGILVAAEESILDANQSLLAKPASQTFLAIPEVARVE